MKYQDRSVLKLLIAGLLALHGPFADAYDATKARQNYERHCAACHGFNGISLNPGVPNLRMNEGLLQLDFQIIQKLKMGSPKKPPMMGVLSDRELQDILTYVRTIH